MDVFIDHIDDIKAFSLIKEISNHDELSLKFRINDDDLKFFEGYLGKDISVKSDKEGNTVLFTGLVTDLHIYLEKGSWYCDLKALSKTSLLDKEEHIRIYQDTEKTILSIIENIYFDYNYDVYFPHKELLDKKHPNIIIQYNETDWQFVNRLCAECGLQIFSNSESDVLSWVGKPDRSANNISEYELVAIDSTDSRLVYDLRINEIYNIGDVLRYDEKEYSVTKIVYEIINNYLYKTYTLSEKSECDDYLLNIQGLVLSAKVIEVDGTGKKNGKIRVQFDIEKDKPANPIWICWATPYSCSDLGFYCMPEIDEIVNVKFMSNSSSEVFAESNIRKYKIPDDIKVSDKLFKIGEKQLLFSENGITIKNDKCEIVIENDKLHISNAKCKIEVAETIKMSLDRLFAEIKEKEIIFDTGSDKIELGNSAIKISSDKIQATAKNVADITADKISISAKSETEIKASSEKISMTSSGTEVSTKNMNVK